MVRLSALVPALCAIAAFVLSMLCIFAGSKPSFMENTDILLLNTSRFGYLEYNNTSTDTPLPWLNSIIDNVTSSIDNDISAVTSDIAKDLGLRDFYTWHILDYCEGYYEPNSTAKHAHRNVTYCSNRTAMFDFNASAILSQQLVANVTLGDLNWPQDVDSTLKDLSTAMKAMFVLYCIGIAATGIVIILGLIAVVVLGRLIGAINFLISLLAFLALGIASAITTAIAVKAANAVNHYGGPLGLAAHKGGKFLAMTWVATGLMLIAAIAWIVECCLPRRRTPKTY